MSSHVQVVRRVGKAYSADVAIRPYSLRKTVVITVTTTMETHRLDVFSSTSPPRSPATRVIPYILVK